MTITDPIKARHLPPLRALACTAGSVLLVTCILPQEPTGSHRVTFEVNPDTLVVAVRGSRAPVIQVLINGVAQTGTVNLVVEGTGDGIADVSGGDVIGVSRGNGHVRVRLVTGAGGSVPVDTLLPVRVVLKSIVLDPPTDTLTALGDTLVVRPAYLDGADVRLPAAESAAVVPQLTLVSAGAAIQSTPGGALVAIANGTDLVQVRADTSLDTLSVLVRQIATRVRGMPDTIRFIALTQTRQLTDSAFDRRGARIVTHATTWATTDPAVVTVSPTGVATAVASGTAYVTARVDGVTDSIGVTVLQTPRRLVSVSGSGQTGTVGTPLASPFVVQVADSLGAAAPVANVPVRFFVDSGGGSFAGSAPVMVNTNAQGRASATYSLGPVAQTVNGVTASAFASGLTGSVLFTSSGGPGPAHHLVSVSGNGQAAGAGRPLTAPFVAGVRDTFGNAVPNAPVRFVVTAGGGNFSGADSVTANSNVQGDAQSSMTLGPTIGVGAHAALARLPGLGSPPVTFLADGLVPVATVSVTPAADTLGVSATVQLTAVARDSTGAVLAGRSVSWTSAAPSVATVSAGGLVTAVASGDVVITASADGRAGTSAITVLGGAASIDVTPDTVNLVSLDTVRLGALLRDAAGHALTGGTVTWTSRNDSIALVSAAGTVAARFSGSTWVVGVTGTFRDSVRVNVTPIAVASMDAEPEPVTLFSLGETVQLTVTARDASNAAIPTARFTYQSSSAGIASVSATGLITAVAPGTATITVSSGAATDDIPVTVSSPAFSCAATGTPHSANIGANETWTKNGSPHRVTSSINVINGATLTIEPGALVCLSSNVEITFNGARLLAVGQSGEANRIVFTATNAAQPWGRLIFTGTPPDSSRLTYARVERTLSWAVDSRPLHPFVIDSVHIRLSQLSALIGNAQTRATRILVDNAGLAGSASGPGVRLYAGAFVDGLVVNNSGAVGVAISGDSITMRNTRIVGSAGRGLLFEGGWLADATGLRVLGGASYPAEGLMVQLAPLLAPIGDSLKGNARDTFLVTAGGLSGGTITLPPTLPYRVSGDQDFNGATARLVLQPGTQLAMDAGVDFAFRGGARLTARGTPAARIVFTKVPSATSWGGLWFEGTPTDSTYITNARFEYGSNPATYNGTQNALIASSGSHPVVLDSVIVRQTVWVGAWLLGSGARISRTSIDTTAYAGLALGNGALLEQSAVHAAGGYGVDVQGTAVRFNSVQIVDTRDLGYANTTTGGPWTGIQALGTFAQFSGVQVTGGGGYPIATGAANLPMVLSQPVGSFLGNARDTLVVLAGTMREAAVTVSKSLPWRLAGNVTFDSLSVVTVEPGAGWAAGSGVRVTFRQTGYLVARGTNAERIVFTAAAAGSPWGGILFEGRSGTFLGGIPRDTSWLVNARIEHASQSSAAAIESRGKHKLLIDSSVIRQSGSHAVHLGGALSRIARSVIDTAGGRGVTLVDTTFADSVTIRRSITTGLTLEGSFSQATRVTALNGGGAGVGVTGASNTLSGVVVANSSGTGVSITGGSNGASNLAVSGAGGTGLDLQALLASGAGPFSATGGASYPLRTHPGNLGLVLPDSAARESFTGSTRDTVLVIAGTVSVPSLLIRPARPWRFEGSTTFTGTLVTVQPGYVFRMGSTQSFTFQGGSRLVARGEPGQMIQFIPDAAANPWGTLSFQGTPGDSSYLTNVRLERGSSSGYMVTTAATHPVIMDSARVRQGRVHGIQLNAPGSRFWRSVMDTTGRDNSGVLVSAGTGLELGAGTSAISSVVRGTGGIGVDVNGAGVRLVNDSVLGSAGVGIDASGGTLVDLAGTRVMAGLSYPLLSQVQTTTIVSPAALLGNVNGDSLAIAGGTLTGATATVTPALPWRVETGFVVDTQAVLVVEPGAGLAMAANQAIQFNRAGRLHARGMVGARVRFGPLSATQPWGGLWFRGPLAVGDTSYLTAVDLERMNGSGMNASVGVWGEHALHPVVLDSARVRQVTAQYGVLLSNAGSRLVRSTVDTAAQATGTAVYLQGGAQMDQDTVRTSGGSGVHVASGASTITNSVIVGGLNQGIHVSGVGSVISTTQVRNSNAIGIQVTVAGVSLIGNRVEGSGGIGVSAPAGLAAYSGDTIVGSGSYPLQSTVQIVGGLTAAERVQLAASHAVDTLVVTGGTLTGATATVTPALPWRVETGFVVDTQAVLVVEPGAGLAMAANQAIQFNRAGRLHARGMVGARVRFGPLSATQPWGGLWFRGPLAVGDTSYLTAVDLERMNGSGMNASVGVWGEHALHPVVLDSARVRQVTAQYGVLLSNAGSRLVRSTVDTAAQATGTAVYLQGGAQMDQDTVRTSGGSGVHVASGASTITNSVIVGGLNQGIHVSGVGSVISTTQVRNSNAIGIQVTVAGVSLIGNRVEGSGGIGVSAPAGLAAYSGDTIVGSGSYPLQSTVQIVGGLTAAERVQLAASHAVDTLVVTGGTLTGATATVTPALPWRVETGFVVDTQAVLVVEPGAGLAMAANQAIQFNRAGRLQARGMVGARVRFGPVNPTQHWGGLWFRGPLAVGDTSYLTAVDLERMNGSGMNASVGVWGEHALHPVVLDSARVRQVTAQYGVLLSNAGSRLVRSTVDTAAQATGTAVYLQGGAQMDQDTVRTSGGSGVHVASGASTITNSVIVGGLNQGIHVSGVGSVISTTQVRNSNAIGIQVTVAGVSLIGNRVEGSGGIGVDAPVDMAALSADTVVGGASYALRTTIQSMARLSPADQPLFLGNARDTIRVSGGTVSNGTATAIAALPWRVEGSITMGAGSVLAALPGARLAMGSTAAMIFSGGGRLHARGSAASPVVITALDSTARWGGLTFQGTLAPGDTSYLTNARMSWSNALVAVYGQSATHPVALDSTLVRRSNQYGLELHAAGSRVSRSVMDTIGSSAAHYGMYLNEAVTVESTTVRRAMGRGIVVTNNTSAARIIGSRVEGSGGIGIDIGAGMAVLSGNTVTGGGSYPISAPIGAIGLLTPADQLLLTGNVRDSLAVIPGTVTGLHVTIGPGPVWRVAGSPVFSTGSTLTMLPGARYGAAGGLDDLLTFQNGARLNARGSAANPITFRVVAGRSFGLVFNGTPSDTSYVFNVSIQMPLRYFLNCPALVNGASTTHPVAIDSSEFKLSSCNGVVLNGPGSRISRSVVDSSGTTGIGLGPDTKAENVKVRGTFGPSAGGHAGIYISGNNVAITGCEIRDGLSAGVFAGSGATAVVTGCNFFNNVGVGINGSFGTINAINNWWGDAGGPNVGSGDGVSGSVTFTPWATVPFVIPLQFP